MSPGAARHRSFFRPPFMEPRAALDLGILVNAETQRGRERRRSRANRSRGRSRDRRVYTAFVRRSFVACSVNPLDGPANASESLPFSSPARSCEEPTRASDRAPSSSKRRAPGAPAALRRHRKTALLACRTARVRYLCAQSIALRTTTAAPRSGSDQASSSYRAHRPRSAGGRDYESQAVVHVAPGGRSRYRCGRDCTVGMS